MGTKIFLITLCTCIVPGQLQWPGGIFQRRHKRPPIDGHWAAWGTWSSCYHNTKDTSSEYYQPWDGFSVQSRNRSCTNPRPLFGGRDCEPPDTRFKQCSCTNPLLGQSRLNPSRITASSSLPRYSPGEVYMGNTTSAGWCAKDTPSFYTETYIQVDFEHFVSVGGIVTVGNENGRVYRYKLKYSLDGDVWTSLRKGSQHVFTGNYLQSKQKKNTFDHHVMRYLRLNVIDYFNRPCLKLEVYGCMFTCGKRLTAAFGEVSARSSSMYDQDCLWKIDVINTTALSFSFNMFYVSCAEGYVNFYSGHKQFSKSKLLKTVCLTEGSLGIPKLELNTISVWMRFVSNSSEEEVGFNIKYFSKCTQVTQLKAGQPVDIISPNYPHNYVNNLNCSWVILPPPSSNKIEITPHQFDVEGGPTSNICSSDVVKFYLSDGQDVGSYCNNNKPKNMVIIARKVVMVFKTDSIVTDKGFRFSIISGSKPPDQSQVHVIDQSGFDSAVLSDAAFNSTQGGKTKTEKDETWTVIVICTFSALVIVLIGTVMYLNCKRWIDNRNDLTAQCRKVAEEEKRRGKGKSGEKNALLLAQKTEQFNGPPVHEVLLGSSSASGESSPIVETAGPLPFNVQQAPSESGASISIRSESSPLPDVDVMGSGGEVDGSEQPVTISSTTDDVTTVPSSSSGPNARETTM